MKFYIKTRSTEIDYNWIKVNNNSDFTEPEFKASESEFQKKLSDFEKTCFWAESSNQKSYLFFTGIPTNRKDKYNRPIRADLVVETDREENQNNEKLIGIVYSFIRSIKKQTKDTLPNTIENSFLSDFINKSLKKEDVDAYLLLTKEIEKLKRNNSNDNRIKEYEEKLKNINITILEDDFLNCKDNIENKSNDNYLKKQSDYDYIGDINDEDSFSQFLKSIEEMILGKANYEIVALCNSLTDINELKKILEEEKKQCVLLGKFENFNHKGMVEAKKKSGYGKSERSVGGTKNPRTDSYSNCAIIVSSELGISDLQSDNAGEPNSDDTGACENKKWSINTDKKSNNSLGQCVNGIMDYAEDIGAPQFIVDLGRRFAGRIDKKKEPKPRDNQRKLGKNIDTKA